MDQAHIEMLIEVLEEALLLDYPMLTDPPEMIAYFLDEHDSRFGQFSESDIADQIKIWQDGKQA